MLSFKSKSGRGDGTAESSAVEASADSDLRVPCYCEENSWRVAYRHLNNAAPDDDTAAPPSSPSSRKRNLHYHVVFVSNERRCCPYFQQRARPPDEYVCWDYHVFVVRSVAADGTKEEAEEEFAAAEALDVDTRLAPYPCPLGDYLDGSFPHCVASVNDRGGLDPSYLPVFRVVRARDYVEDFYSDRMHMFRDGEWSAPPPAYDPIMNGLDSKRAAAAGEDGAGGYERDRSNLETYVCMDPTRDQRRDGGDGTEGGRFGKVLSLAQFRAMFAS